LSPVLGIFVFCPIKRSMDEVFIGLLLGGLTNSGNYR
jgi:hypothetical protein